MQKKTYISYKLISRERDTIGVSEDSKDLIPGSTKYNEAILFGQKAYVLGTSMVKDIRRNEFNPA